MKIVIDIDEIYLLGYLIMELKQVRKTEKQLTEQFVMVNFMKKDTQNQRDIG